MILCFEMVWPGTGHTVTNSSIVQTIARALPEQSVRVFAESTHLRELQSDAVLLRLNNVSLRAIRISPRFMFRPHIVSMRRGLRELWTLLLALRDVPKQEPCLLMLLSATPTAIFSASLLARVTRRYIRVQVGLHGNLNDAFGWRPRNPVARAIDLHAALTRRDRGRVRFLVLENAVRAALADQIPSTADITDVLPSPVNEAEAEQAEPLKLTFPLRIGLVGQATEAKGIMAFLALARRFRQTRPDAFNFHLVGHPGAGIVIDEFDALHDELPYERLSRAEFLKRLCRLHYVCLPLQPSYYGLSSSGALIDAINWLKPIIATPVPIVVDLFARFGDIGLLCDDFNSMAIGIDSLARNPDQERYDRQVANLRVIRDSRIPTALATNYRAIVERGFPGLLTGPSRVLAHNAPHGENQIRFGA
jgi:hypothetical protein